MMSSCLPKRGTLVVLETSDGEASYTGFFRSLTPDRAFELYDANDATGRYVGTVSLPIEQVKKFLISDEVSDVESCNSDESSDDLGSLDRSSHSDSIASSAAAAAAAAAAAVAVAASSPRECSTKSSNNAEQTTNIDSKLRNTRLLADKCPLPKIQVGLPLDAKDNPHGMLYELSQVDPNNYCLPPGFVNADDLPPEAIVAASCVMVTTPSGVERAVARLSSAELLAVLCHGGDLRQLATNDRPSLISVAIFNSTNNSSVVFLFDLDSCLAAALPALSRLLSGRFRNAASQQRLVIVSYDCRLLKQHVLSASTRCTNTCGNYLDGINFVDLQILSASVEQLYSGGRCFHVSRSLNKLMRTYLGLDQPYLEPQTREDMLAEDAKIWHRRPLHPILASSAYNKSELMLPLYNRMLDALLGPIYNSSQHRMLIGQQNLEDGRTVQHAYCNLFAPNSKFLSATSTAAGTNDTTADSQASRSSNNGTLRHAQSAVAVLDRRLELFTSSTVPKTTAAAAATAHTVNEQPTIVAAKPQRNSMPQDGATTTVLLVSRESAAFSANNAIGGPAIASAFESGLPTESFCSIPSPTALDEMRAAAKSASSLPVHDAKKDNNKGSRSSSGRSDGGASTSSCYSSCGSDIIVCQQGVAETKTGLGRGLKRSSELEFSMPSMQQQQQQQQTMTLTSTLIGRGRCRGTISGGGGDASFIADSTKIVETSPRSPMSLSEPDAAALLPFGRGRGGRI